MLSQTWKNYKEYLREIKWPFEPKKWLVISVVLAIVTFLLVWVLLGVLQIFPMKTLHAVLFAVVSFVAVLDLVLAYPYLLAVRRIALIEDALPDAFKQMADTLKAGGTFEYALRTVSSAEYGPLTEEVSLVLRRLEEGENLENSLRGFAHNVNSRVLKRAVDIILDSIAAGASLADILDEIADDVRATHRIVKERKSTTLMQVLFMVTAGILISPFIFGLITAIVEFLMGQTLATIQMLPAGRQDRIPGAEASVFCNPGSFITQAGPDVVGFWSCVRDSITFLLVVYIIIESIAVGLMVSMIREGNVSKSFIYIPAFLFIAYTVYFVSYVGVSGFFGR